MKIFIHAVIFSSIFGWALGVAAKGSPKGVSGRTTTKNIQEAQATRKSWVKQDPQSFFTPKPGFYLQTLQLWSSKQELGLLLNKELSRYQEDVGFSKNLASLMTSAFFFPILSEAAKVMEPLVKRDDFQDGRFMTPLIASPLRPLLKGLDSGSTPKGLRRSFEKDLLPLLFEFQSLATAKNWKLTPETTLHPEVLELTRAIKGLIETLSSDKGDKKKRQLFRTQFKEAEELLLKLNDID